MKFDPKTILPMELLIADLLKNDLFILTPTLEKIFFVFLSRFEDLNLVLVCGHFGV